jgi:hypothetical protein
VPTPEAERLFLDSFTSTREHYRQSLDALSAGALNLPNTDLDTGKSSASGEYALADETYDDLLDKLADHKFAGVPEAMRADLIAHYGAAGPAPDATRAQQKRADRIRSQVALLTETRVGS